RAGVGIEQRETDAPAGRERPSAIGLWIDLEARAQAIVQLPKRIDGRESLAFRLEEILLVGARVRERHVVAWSAQDPLDDGGRLGVRLARKGFLGIPPLLNDVLRAELGGQRGHDQERNAWEDAGDAPRRGNGDHEYSGIGAGAGVELQLYDIGRTPVAH